MGDLVRRRARCSGCGVVSEPRASGRTPPRWSRETPGGQGRYFCPVCSEGAEEPMDYRSIPERMREDGYLILAPGSPERTALSRALGLATALRDYPEGVPTRGGGVRDVASEIVTLLEGIVG